MRWVESDVEQRSYGCVVGRSLRMARWVKGYGQLKHGGGCEIDEDRWL